jgi:hypothetical protein
MRAAGRYLRNVIAMFATVVAFAPNLVRAADPLTLAAANARPRSLVASAAESTVALAWYAGDEAAVTVALSHDNGQSFSAPVVLGHARVAAGAVQPVVVVEPLGPNLPRVSVAWPAEAGGIVIARNGTERGASFLQSHFTAPQLPGGATVAALALARGEGLDALWLAGSRVLYSRATGAGFGPVIVVDQQATRCGIAAVVARDRQSVIVLWHRSFGAAGEDFAYAVSPDGAAFTAAARVSNEPWGFASCPREAPSVTLDRNGALRFAFAAQPANAETSFFIDRSQDGTTFRPRSFVDFGQFRDARSPQVAPDRTGGLALAWDGIRNERRYVMIRHSLGAPNGSGALDGDWMRPAPPIVLDQSGRGSSPALAATNDGMIAAWLAGTGPETLVATRRLSVDQLCGLAPPP